VCHQNILENKNVEFFQVKELVVTGESELHKRMRSARNNKQMSKYTKMLKIIKY
jgi:hypothetical protein